MRFDILMLDSDVGQIIVPAVINQVNNYSTTIEQGRTFRAAGKVYRIAEQPYFVNQPPNWRSYLNLNYDQPKIPSPSVLPKNEREIEIFKTYLVKGFITGINVVEQRAEVAYEKMVADFDGMSLYHVLLDYEMVSMPNIETNYSAVAVNRKGDEMSIDDTIMRITIHPRLDGNRDKWKALSALNEFDLNIMDSNFSNWDSK
jgi:defect-in-organelle-trafficking protein DotC